MQSLLVRASLLAAVGIVLTAARSASAAHDLQFYLSAPQSTSSVYSGTTVETFNNLSTGNRTANYNSAIGTYALSSSNPFSIQADDQYGAGTGNYMAIGSQAGSSAPVTLTFSSSISYFGFSWDAGDANNGLSFYSGSTLIGRFSSSSIINKLSASTVTSIGGTTYNSSSYYGKPGSTSSNSGEPYAFINFIDSKGTFDRVVFDNSGTTSTGYETDNHTIRIAAPTADSSFVYVGSVATPEPGTLALLLPGLPLLAFRRRSRTTVRTK